MMKLSEIQGEKALDVLADLLEPACEIFADAEIKEAAMHESKIAAVKKAIKSHKKAVIEILAILDDVPVEEYKVNLFTLPLKMLELLNDPELIQLFRLQEQTGDAKSSTPVSANAE